MGTTTTTSTVATSPLPASASAYAAVNGVAPSSSSTGALTGEKAAGHLTLAGYAEGTNYHKAITVFNEGCGNVNLGKYRIDIYHNGGIKRNFYINLPNKILASGKSFNICNSKAKGNEDYSKAWRKACGQYSKYLQHNGNDVIELYHGKDLIYTIGGRGYDKTFGKDKTCLRTGPGEWPKAWDCKYKANTVPSGRKMQQPLGCAKF